MTVIIVSWLSIRAGFYDLTVVYWSLRLVN